jgi:hypothetical protein
MKMFQSIGKLFLGLIGLIVLVVIIALCMGGKDEATKVTTKDGKQVEVKGDATAKLGDTVKVGDWEYTFISAKTAKTVKGIVQNETPDSDQFIVVKVKAVNVGKDKSTLSESLFKLKDKEDAEYEASTKLFNEMMLKPLNPHGSFTGEIAFEVPNGKTTDFKLEAQGGFASSKTVTVELG